MYQIQFDDDIETPDTGIPASLGPLVEHVCTRFEVGKPVHVIITTDDQMRHLNSTFRGRQESTDVLSFELGGDEFSHLGGEDVSAANEIYVSLPRARVQAESQGVSLIDEVNRLVAHGLLHLAGYDHDTPDALRKMELETERILRSSVPTDSEARN